MTQSHYWENESEKEREGGRTGREREREGKRGERESCIWYGFK